MECENCDCLRNGSGLGQVFDLKGTPWVCGPQVFPLGILVVFQLDACPLSTQIGMPVAVSHVIS